MFIVFDLDGTLANDYHRSGLVGQWDEYFDACDGDAPIPHVIQVLADLSAAGHRIEIWSGRGEGPENSALHKTVKWLEINGIYKHVKQLLMRAHGDHRRDTELKTEWMATWGEPDLVFDDRDQAVKMWREAGVPCFQVAPGDF